MLTRGAQLKTPWVASTEPHLPAFSGVTWFQYLVKVEGVLPLIVLPRNLLLPLAICATACVGSIASATSESAASSCARIVRSVFMDLPPWKFRYGYRYQFQCIRYQSRPRNLAPASRGNARERPSDASG